MIIIMILIVDNYANLAALRPLRQLGGSQPKPHRASRDENTDSLHCPKNINNNIKQKSRKQRRVEHRHSHTYTTFTSLERVGFFGVVLVGPWWGGRDSRLRIENRPFSSVISWLCVLWLLLSFSAYPLTAYYNTKSFCHYYTFPIVTVCPV